MSTSLDVLLGMRSASEASVNSVTHVTSRTNRIEQTFAELSSEWMHLMAAEQVALRPSLADNAAPETAAESTANSDGHSNGDTSEILIAESSGATSPHPSLIGHESARNVANSRNLGLSQYQDSLIANAEDHATLPASIDQLDFPAGPVVATSTDLDRAKYMGQVRDNLHIYQSRQSLRRTGVISARPYLDSVDTPLLHAQVLSELNPAGSAPVLSKQLTSESSQSSSAAEISRPASPELTVASDAAVVISEQMIGEKLVGDSGRSTSIAGEFNGRQSLEAVVGAPETTIDNSLSIDRLNQAPLDKTTAETSLSLNTEVISNSSENGVETSLNHISDLASPDQMLDTKLELANATEASSRQSKNKATGSGSHIRITNPTGSVLAAVGSTQNTVATRSNNDRNDRAILEVLGRVDSSSSNVVEAGLLRMRSSGAYFGSQSSDGQQSRRDTFKASVARDQQVFGASATGNQPAFSVQTVRTVGPVGLPSSVREVTSFAVEQVRSSNLDQGITVELQHPELGIVRLSAMLEDGRVRINLQAQWEQTAAMLTFHKDEMQQLMQNSGLNGAHCNITWEQESNSGYSNDDQYHWGEQTEDEIDQSRGQHRSDSERAAELNLVL